MLPPILSQSNRLSLEEVLARLASHSQVEGILTLGSTRAGALQPHSDYDLLVVLSQMPVPLRVILTTIDGRLTDVLFAHSDLIARIVSGQYPIAGTADEGALVERLKTGEVVHDRTGRIRQAQTLLADRDWLVKPSDAEVYDRAVHGIHYNYQQNKRYLECDDPVYQLVLDFRLHYSLTQVLWDYFIVRRIPWQGEKKAFAYWHEHDPEYLALFQAYHATTDRREKFAIYTQMAQRTMEPIGGMWPPQAVNVALNADEFDLEDVDKAIRFWESLLV
jgi:predicted nucleotidyltransferase